MTFKHVTHKCWNLVENIATFQLRAWRMKLDFIIYQIIICENLNTFASVWRLKPNAYFSEIITFPFKLSTYKAINTIALFSLNWWRKRKNCYYFFSWFYYPSKNSSPCVDDHSKHSVSASIRIFIRNTSFCTKKFILFCPSTIKICNNEVWKCHKKTLWFSMKYGFINPNTAKCKAKHL